MQKYNQTLYVSILLLLGVIVIMLVQNNMWSPYDEVTNLLLDSVVRGNKALASRLCGRHREVLYGVFSTADKMQTRNAARQQIHCNLNSIGHHTIFVIGTPRTEREYTILHEEQRLYGDIFILTCEENMNGGKTYTYFKEAMETFPCFNFYAKVDDDTAFAPDKLSAKLRSMPNDMALHIGRLYRSDATWKLFFKWIYYGFRDFSWTQRLQNYTSGMLYILNAQAVKQWIVLNPTQLYGDEDMRTTYFMKLIGAQVINVGTVFHDHISSKSEWKLEITNASLAVHRCKTAQMLSDSFASICT